MSHIALSKSAEIDRNLVRFLELLPMLIDEHAGQYALLRHGELVAIYPDAIDAQIAGNQQFEDHVFSIQRVQEITEELGHFAYALSSR